MLWLVLSYIPAKIWFTFLLWSSTCWGVAITLRLAAGQTSYLEEFIPWAAVMAGCLYTFRLRSRKRHFVKTLRAQAREVRNRIPGRTLEILDITWLVEHFLRLRTGGVMAICYSVAYAIILITGFGFDLLMTENSPTRIKWIFAIGILATLLLWAGAILGGIKGRLIITNQVLGYTLALTLIAFSTFFWLEMLKGASSVLESLKIIAVITVGSLAILPVSTLTLATPVIALKLLLGTYLLGRKTGEERLPSLRASLSDVSREKMSLIDEGLIDKNPYYSSRRRGALGALAIAFSLAAATGGITIAVVIGALAPLLSFVTMPLLWMSMSAWELSNRLRLLAAEDVLASDPRPPVLILRSFADDRLGIQGRALLQWRAKILEVATIWGSRLGPVITFGRPGEKLADAGPPRLYVENDRWQTVLLDYMKASRLIFVFIGETESLDWEIRQILSGGHLHKAIFILPPVPMARKKARWEKLQTLIADSLPRHSRKLPLQAIDPSTALMIGQDQGRLFCVSSEVHNKLAYDIAIKSLVNHLGRQAPTQ